MPPGTVQSVRSTSRPPRSSTCGICPRSWSFIWSDSPTAGSIGTRSTPSWNSPSGDVSMFVGSQSHWQCQIKEAFLCPTPTTSSPHPQIFCKSKIYHWLNLSSDFIIEKHTLICEVCPYPFLIYYSCCSVWFSYWLILLRTVIMPLIIR